MLYANGEKMELVIKRFDELSTEELFEIYKLRVSVFVVEQNCPYQEVDDADKSAYHIFFKDSDGIAAYLRLVDKGVIFEDAAIGRVISVKRRRGLAGSLLDKAMAFAVECINVDSITLEAQVYARSLYEKAGFTTVSEEFLEDGIPHIRMRWKKA